MFMNALKNVFNRSSLDSGKDCLINYVWLNDKPDESGREVECSVSLKHLDCAYENARKYPDARVKIWLDYRFLDDRSRVCLQKHLERFAPDNVEFSDINDIPLYHDEEMFDPKKTIDLWGEGGAWEKACINDYGAVPVN